jgi:hypothetical protein
MRDYPKERPVPYWLWAGFVFYVTLVIDPLHSFLANVAILGFTIFVGILLRCPDSLKTLKDANDRLETHRREIRNARH